MKRFLGLTAYEIRMSLRRVSFWLGFGLLALPYLLEISAPLTGQTTSMEETVGTLGFSLFQLNLLLPVVAGILIADRLVRDQRLNMTELQNSTPLGIISYLLAKYFGSLISVLTPVFSLWVILVIALLANGLPFNEVPRFFLGFLAINVPAYAFLTAFSLVCPLIMPVRVYQVLFTGYWFWGNFLNPAVLPTLNGTLLTPSGEFMMGAFFSPNLPFTASYPPIMAFLNLLVLGLCITAALSFGAAVLGRKQRLA
ncbi:MAG TPA: hypothetical protein PKW33_02265 [Anaerolineaceae bacterium]|nr:hypothetical protein [Anaerolineaceae bacterium]HPN50385.1 hypothetical protein [Anaerolineaceae bacterium]